jgi:hypothetical protein
LEYSEYEMAENHHLLENIFYLFGFNSKEKKLTKKTTIIAIIEAGAALVNLSTKSTIPIIKATKPA